MQSHRRPAAVDRHAPELVALVHRLVGAVHDARAVRADQERLHVATADDGTAQLDGDAAAVQPHAVERELAQRVELAVDDPRPVRADGEARAHVLAGGEHDRGLAAVDRHAVEVLDVVRHRVGHEDDVHAVGADPELVARRRKPKPTSPKGPSGMFSLTGVAPPRVGTL